MEFFSLSPAETAAMKLSLRVACWAVFFSLPPGVFMAWLISRTRFPGRGLLDSVIHLPLVLPPVVVGYFLLVACGKNGVIGSFLYTHCGITLAFNWKGAVLASAVMAFPLLVRAIRLSLESVDRGLEDAARTLGAGPFRVFFMITLPLSLPGVITGALLAFARSLGEFGATIMFVSNIPGETQTLPLALYTLTQVPGGEAGAMRLCVLAVAVAVAAMVCSNVLAKQCAKKLGG